MPRTAPSKEWILGQAYRHDDSTGDFCKVGRDEEGAASNRAERMCSRMCSSGTSDATEYADSRKPLVLLTNSLRLLMAI